MAGINRRQMLAAIGSAGAMAAAQAGKRRNIIFILSDDHRYDALAFVTTALCSPGDTQNLVIS